MSHSDPTLSRTTFPVPTLLALLPLLAALTTACAPDLPGEARFDSDVPRRLVNGDPSCPECAIDLVEQAVLGSPGDPTSIKPGPGPCGIGVLSTGEYVAASTVGGGGVVVYGADGRARRTIGRRGRGPGEFGGTLLVVVRPGDTLQVVDNSNRRVTTMTAAGELVRSYPWPNRVRGIAPLPGGALLLHATPFPDVDWQLFHLVNAAGEEVAAFGEPLEELLDVDQWTVSPARPAGFWTASLWTYELYRWDGPGELRETLVRQAAFMPEPDLSQRAFERVYREIPPPAGLWHIWQDEEDRVWTYTLVPDADWKPDPGPTGSVDWFRRNLDMMIEVIDLDRRRVVTRRRYDDILAPVCGTDLVYAVVESEDGDTRARVFRPEVVDP